MMTTNVSKPMVSIFCITYNHGEYIAQCLDGFLMQKCTFDVEIIVGDDCSTDGTTEVIDQYVAKYPGRLIRLPADGNLGPNKNAVNIARHLNGKYVALCDGDDFWSDPLKLQKQVDFLEAHEEYVVCGHYTKIINSDGGLLEVHPKPVFLTYAFSELMVNKQAETATASLVYRNTEEIKRMYFTDWFLKVNAADKFVKLYTTWSTGKKIAVLPEVMSCYRKHVGGIWSQTPRLPLKKKQLSDFQIILDIFTFTKLQKIKLFYFYLKAYFLYEVRYKSVEHASRTITKLWTR